MFLRRILTCCAVYPTQNGVTEQNGEQPIRLPNGLLYPRVEVEQRTHSGDEIEDSVQMPLSGFLQREIFVESNLPIFQKLIKT